MQDLSDMFQWNEDATASPSKPEDEIYNKIENLSSEEEPPRYGGGSNTSNKRRTRQDRVKLKEFHDQDQHNVNTTDQLNSLIFSQQQNECENLCTTQENKLTELEEQSP